MTALSDLIDAQQAVVRQIGTLGDDRWGLPTPCGGWSVERLVVHLVEGSQMAARMLEGAPRDEIMALFGQPHLDLVAEAPERFAAEAAAFDRPGLAEQTVEHPMAGQLQAPMFLGMRTTDFVLHSWDLARALGEDETLPPHLVDAAWATLEPLGPVIGQIGVFGEGPSGTVDEGAPLALRVLDLSGRRP